MVAAAWGGAEGADVIALVVDAKGGLGPKVMPIAESIAGRPERKFLILNKVDIADKAAAARSMPSGSTPRCTFDETFFVSAETGDGLPELKARIRRARCPRGRGISPRTRSATRPSARWPPK